MSKFQGCLNNFGGPQSGNVERRIRSSAYKRWLSSIPGGGYSYIFMNGDVPLNRISFSGF